MSDGWYKGKEPCQACGKSGTEIPRWSKNELCQDCKEIIKKWKSASGELKYKYIGVRQHYFAFSSLNFDDNTLNSAIIDLIIALSNGYADPETRTNCFKYSQGDNCVYGNIPEPFFEPIKKLFLILDDYVRNIRKESDGLPEKTKKEVQKEKDRIYNEGVQKGRDLLFALNNGEITMSEFSERISYREKENP